MGADNPARELFDGYNNVIGHLEFIQDLANSLCSLREKLEEALNEGDEVAPAIIIAMKIQMNAGILSGIINYPGILNEKIKVFESLITPPEKPPKLDPSRN